MADLVTPARKLARWGALVAGVVAAGCGPAADGPRRIVQRLVGADQVARVVPASLVLRDESTFPTQRSAVSRIPTATIADDTRYVLAGYERANVAFVQRGRSSAEGEVVFELDASPLSPGATAAWLVPTLLLEGSRDWQQQEPVAVRIADRDGRRVLPLRLSVGEADRAVTLNAVAYRLPDTSESEISTRPVTFPDHAVLEVSLGRLAVEPASSPVRYAIDVCRGTDCAEVFAESLSAEQLATWNDRRIPLDGAAGETVSLRFRSASESAGDPAPLVVWGDPRIVAPWKAAVEPPPSVLLLSIDTLRADHTEPYGYGRATSPFLTELAGRGVVFEHAIAEASTTDPSHMTLFTSVPADRHGVECCMQGLAAPVTTLAESLRAAGFATVAYTENGAIAHDRGFSIGFDRFVENKSADLFEPTGQVALTFGQARRWLDGAGDRPFFLFLHTYQVHAPYHPPARYRKFFAEGLPDDRRARMVADYDREIRFVDDELRSLLEWMDGAGHLANTLVVVTSDHGEEFFEHGSLGHATLPYESVLRVPLIVTGPGVVGGRRIPAMVHHLDYLPTILEFVGVPVPDSALGRSLAPVLRGKGEPPADRPLFISRVCPPPGMPRHLHRNQLTG